MIEFFEVFLQRKQVFEIVRERPTVSKSLFWYIVALGVFLAGATIGTLFENLIFVLLGGQSLFGSVVAALIFFGAFVLLAIPKLIGFFVLIFLYYIFGKIFGAKQVDFNHFLANSLVVWGSVVFVAGLFAVVPFLRYLALPLIALYGVFLFIKLISEYFYYSFAKAFFVWFIPSAIIGAMLLVVGLVIFGALFLYSFS